MKICKIRKLIETLETIKPEQYDQMCWYARNPHCGTRACLGGYTLLMENYEIELNIKHYHVEKASGLPVAVRARQILGISKSTAAVLFHAFRTGWRREDQARAAKTLQELVQVAIAELEDLIQLGPYQPPESAKAQPARQRARPEPHHRRTTRQSPPTSSFPPEGPSRLAALVTR